MDQILAIIAMFVGWGLNEFSQIYRSSREHKQAISHALSILLEVRFQAVYLEHLLPKLKEQGVPSEAMPMLRTLLEDVGLGKDDSKEYERALRIVAKNAPLVAYNYRSRASFPQFVKKIRALAMKDGVDPAAVETIENSLTSLFIPKINEFIVNLAEIHSNRLKKDVEAIINKEVEIPEGFENYLAALRETSQKRGT